uniref:B30.2/SPRY domain-containing protein n=1 Tax=Esox lucius TaxID=8010 RepID=A0A6Q2YWC0_ESOLU
MCHIPVFCWIVATILEYMLTTDDKVELPKTLTDMYSHFLVFQSTHRNVKYDGKKETDPHWSKESILTLGKLAFQQLQKGNLIFYEEDLKECGIDINEASVYSGVCTQIFKEECGLNQDKVFCFVHLSIQEFLSAVYVFLSFKNNNKNLMDEQQSTDGNVSVQLRYEPEVTFYKTAVDEAFQSKTGHLDLFLRFLVGLSLESNQKHLRGLLRKTRSSSQNHKGTIKYIKEKIRENPSSERCINLFHCLNELNDHSLVEEIQRYLSSGRLSREELSPAQWSALVFVLLTSEEEIDVFDLKKYSKSEKGLLGLLPVIKTCRTALLSGCRITKEGCASLVSALKSNPSHLKELDLSYNQPEDSGVMELSALMEDPQCRLETLRLSGCRITKEGCASLVSTLKSNPSHLKELDLSYNQPEDSGVKKLSALLKDPQCRLETLRLSGCGITEEGCASLGSALKSNPSHLKELDLSKNDLKDTGVEKLSGWLKDPQCRLETLRLSGCLVTKEGCASLVSALKSNPSHLKELDLSYNHPGDLGFRLFSAGLEDPHWRLEKLNMDHGGEWMLKSGLKKYVCDLTLDPNTVNRNLSLSEENRKVTRRREEQLYPDHPERFEYQSQVLCREGLSGRCYWEVVWSGGGTVIGVTYKGINRRGRGGDCCLGYNDKSWILDCNSNSYSVRHNKKTTVLPDTSSDSHRVGVYLDWPAGTLSFYRVSSGILTHLYTFNTTFTEPLYPGFWVYYSDSSVSLCQMVPVSNTT